MMAVTWVALSWVAFCGSHIILSMKWARVPLAARLGERGFTYLYTVLASLQFVGLCALYARFQHEGPAGLSLAGSPVVRGVRGVLYGVSAVGVVMMIAPFAPYGYWDSPVGVFVRGVRPPHGLERITRHPFFAGTVLAMGAHALLATHLTGTVFFGGFVVLSTVGPMHQARKLRARHGEAFDDYLAQTSAIPFVAILRGKQRLVLGELPWLGIALGALAAYGLRRAHGGIFDHHGLYVSGTIVLASVLIGEIQARRQRVA